MSILDDIKDEIKELTHRIEGAVEGEGAKVEAAAVTDVQAVAADLAAPAVDYAAKLAAALKDILPGSWDPAHPSADLYAKAKEALDAYLSSLV